MQDFAHIVECDDSIMTTTMINLTGHKNNVRTHSPELAWTSTSHFRAFWGSQASKLHMQQTAAMLDHIPTNLNLV